MKKISVTINCTNAEFKSMVEQGKADENGNIMLSVPIKAEDENLSKILEPGNYLAVVDNIQFLPAMKAKTKKKLKDKSK